MGNLEDPWECSFLAFHGLKVQLIDLIQAKICLPENRPIAGERREQLLVPWELLESEMFKTADYHQKFLPLNGLSSFKIKIRKKEEN